VIRLRKGQIPQVLVDNAASWTKEYCDARNHGVEISRTVRFRYRHKEIKAALRLEAHDKCIYCEELGGFGETDHLTPVSKAPDQILAWSNLAFVCKECNTSKSDYYAPEEPLINPFDDDPEDHLVFLGPWVHPRLESDMGLRTLLQLKLNRTDLIQKRATRLERLMPLVRGWWNYPEGATKKLLHQAILDQADDDEEFAATVRGFLWHVLNIAWTASHA
jgi:hypothetical protein